jgi:hypothetical protein
VVEVEMGITLGVGMETSTMKDEQRRWERTSG